MIWSQFILLVSSLAPLCRACNIWAENHSTVLSNSRRDWHKRHYKGTWWKLGDKMEMGSEDNGRCHRWLWRFETGDIECLPIALGIHLGSQPWNKSPCDIWPLTPILPSLITTISLIYWLQVQGFQFSEPTRLLLNSEFQMLSMAYMLLPLLSE